MPQKQNQAIRNELRRNAWLESFSSPSNANHTHNGTDSPFVNEDSLVLGSKIRSLFTAQNATIATINSRAPLQGVTTPSRITFYGSADDGGPLVLQLTAGPSMGATSATLTTAWRRTQASYSTVFSNGDVRSVNYTFDGTSITWSGGLTTAATEFITIPEPPISRIGLAQGSIIYGDTANGVGSPQVLTEIGEPFIQGGNYQYSDSAQHSNFRTGTSGSAIEIRDHTASLMALFRLISRDPSLTASAPTAFQDTGTLQFIYTLAPSWRMQVRILMG